MKLFLILISLGISQQLFASSPVWLVESANNRLYLAGTIHLLRASDFPLPKAFEAAYKQSQILAFETDIGESQSPAFQQQMIRAVSLKKGETLQSLLSPKIYAELNAHFQTNNLSIQHFSRFKPSMIAITLTLLELKKLGVGSHGVDHHYFSQATRDNKQTLSLESLQQQINFLATMGEGQEDLMIEQTLNDIGTLSTQFPDMIKSWRKGDTEQLDSLFVEPMRKEFDAVYQQLLVQRNNAWMPQIINYLTTAETEMVLVGAAHLVGSDGLIKQLKQAGYKITQLD